MKAANRTIGAVAVQDVLSFEAAPTSSEWTLAQKEKLRQLLLFDERKPLEKVPYDFRFIWKDGDGEQHDSLVIAWEMYQTWRTYRREYEDPIQKMRTKWLGDLCGPEREPAFIVGNLANRRQVFVICGWFCPPKKVSQNETLW